jgi:hypothetical protein
VRLSQERRGADHVADDLAAFGAPEAAAAYAQRTQAEDQAEHCLVEPANWPALQAFLAVQSQFRRTGLRYEGVYWGLRMKGIRCTPDLFARLQLIEAGALAALAEHADD